MNQIYAIDSTRISHREYWWGTKSPLVLIGWFTKWFRIRIPGSTDDPNFESTVPCAVESLPSEVLERFQPLGAELAALGFYDVAYHCFRDAGTQTTIYWATFLHESGTHFARIHQRLWGQSQKVSRALFPMFFTEFTDGTFLVSSSGKPDTLTPDTVRMNRMFRAPTRKMWEAHLQQAATYGAQRMAARVATAEEALAATERHHRLLRDFNLERGVFRVRTEAEQSKADAFAASIAAAEAKGLQHGEVLAELERLQDKKASWAGSLWILLISIVIFIAAGAARWDWKFTLWLIPVLLFHEAGHWIAMRTFRYRNLRMFFIPLFGAAVSGQHWNVPGWKKAIVSLAGPVPGIVLGCALAIVAFFVRNSWLDELALILLVLNGINLLPVLPLDGGHVLHATLFCRNRWLDLVFRCVAVGLLLLLSLVLGRGMLFIAIALGVTLPLMFRQGKVVDLMRKTPLPPPPLDSDRIPPETAQAIISAFKADQPKGMSTKMLAQQTLAVYETLNARPPGAGATIGLLAVHGGAFFCSLLFCGLLAVSKVGGGFGELVSTAARQPQHEVNLREPIPTWRGSESGADPLRNVMVATYDRQSVAAAAYSNHISRLPGTASLSLFGDSLLLSLPTKEDAARERWFGILQAETTNTFVVISNHPVTMTLFFLAPDEAAATNLTQELTACGALPGASLIPPWAAEAKMPAYTNYLQARLAWLRLVRDEYKLWTQPAVTSLNKKIAAATRRGATTEAEQLGAQREQLIKDLKRKHLEEVRAELIHTPALALVDLHVRLDELSYTNRLERKALTQRVAQLLGELPKADGIAAATAGGYINSARNTGLFVEVPWCRFDHPQTTLPLVLEWLRERKCVGLKYTFHENLYFGDLEAALDEEE